MNRQVIAKGFIEMQYGQSPDTLFYNTIGSAISIRGACKLLDEMKGKYVQVVVEEIENGEPTQQIDGSEGSFWILIEHIESKKLFRFPRAFESRIPEGYMKVYIIQDCGFHGPVYDANGKLLSRFWSEKRYPFNSTISASL